MPPTDGLDELALMRFRDECGWSSSTAISASRPSRIGADRRSAMRCVSSVRALCRAAPIARRKHRIGRRENVLVAEPGARPRQQRGGPLEPQRLVLEEPRQPFSGGGIESAQTQVLADALLMFGDRLLPAGVGVDRLGVGSQLQGGEPQDRAYCDLNGGRAPKDASRSGFPSLSP